MAITLKQADALRKLGQLPPEELINPTALSDILLQWGEDAVKELQAEIAKNKGNASYALSQSIAPRITTQGASITRLELLMNEYSEWYNDGRRAGKKPPLAAIMEWIKNKGLIKRSNKPTLEANRQLAYSIQSAIAKRGTIKRFGYKGSDFLTNVINQNSLQKLSDSIAEVIGQRLNVTLNVKQEGE